jgi:hypothetical protein
LVLTLLVSLTSSKLKFEFFQKQQKVSFKYKKDHVI